jgi:hypothetical protein
MQPVCYFFSKRLFPSNKMTLPHLFEWSYLGSTGVGLIPRMSNLSQITYESKVITEWT